MRQRNGSFWGIAVLASLLGLLVLSGGAVAGTSDGQPPGTDASDKGTSSQDEGGDVGAQGRDTGGASGEESEDVGTTGENSEDGSGDRDCADFDSQEEAQNFFEQQRGQDGEDPDRLDADGDGQACEDSDFGDNFPNGGVETGFGGVDGRATTVSSVNVPLAAGGTALALLSLGLAALALRRRA